MSSNLKIRFVSREDYSNVNVYTSEYASQFFEKTRHVIQSLSHIERIFVNNKITVPISDLVKHLIIIGGKKEQRYIDKKFKSNKLWNNYTFFDGNLDAIVIDISNYKSNEELIGALVHEIGHAIHTKYITPNSRKYSYDIGNVYSEVILDLTEVRDAVYHSSDDDEKDSYVRDAQVMFAEFIAVLNKSNNNNMSNISLSIINSYKTSSNFTPADSINNMIKSIMAFIPSKYGASNSFEFFAECFRQFILDPDALSLSNRNMIINTFQMSSAAGKEVMKAHKLIQQYVSTLLS